MSKVIRITSGTEKVLEEVKEKMETFYYEQTNVKIDLKYDDIIRNALIAQEEKIKKY